MDIFERTLVNGLAYMEIAVGIALWVDGYRKSGFVPDKLNIRFLSMPIFPPKILYFLGGKPTSAKYPEGVMTAWAFVGQFMGLSFITHAVIATYFSLRATEFVASLFLTMGLSYLFTYWLTRNRAYK
jgi:hypothetical protein